MISPTAFQKIYRLLLSHSSSPVTEQHNVSTENSAGAQIVLQKVIVAV